MSNFYENLLSHVGKSVIKEEFRGGNSMTKGLIAIEAKVGLGKSTLMKIMAEDGFIPFPEPVIDNPLLDKFYHDRTRYSFSLQVYFLNKRFRHIKEAERIENGVLDRSIYGDAIFAKMLHDNGEMSHEEFELYQDLLENMLEHINPPRLMVFLDGSVDEAIRRIKKRGRDYELIVEREYWEKLDVEYKSYFNQYKISPILKINVDGLDYENNMEDRQNVLNLIYSKLAEIDKSALEEAAASK
jgi:deoxyadenosine/deoxycytidine kinase